MSRLLYLALGAVLIGGAAFWMLTRPEQLAPDALAGLTGDALRGAAVFHAGGCVSCHAAPGAEGDARLVLAGGQSFPSPFGTFKAPNISNDPTVGIGGWSALDLANAMLHGTSPDGAHYYPAFPYGTYRQANLQDIVDLRAYLATLPADATPNQPHGLGFPFTIRRGLGLWKLAFARGGWVVTGDLTPAETRGRYLAEALGHCAECHTPRNALGGLDKSRWLAGAPDPSGKGTVPNITPAKLQWSESEIVEYLTSGFTPDFDSAGGHMAHVVGNFAQLPDADRAAVAAYLKKVPAVN